MIFSRLIVCRLVLPVAMAAVFPSDERIVTHATAPLRMNLHSNGNRRSLSPASSRLYQAHRRRHHLTGAAAPGETSDTAAGGRRNDVRRSSRVLEATENVAP
jgi:hypothetical protein